MALAQAVHAQHGQVAIPAYVIRSHFTASSASADTHSELSSNVVIYLPSPPMQLCKLISWYWKQSLTRVVVACSGGGEPAAAQRRAGAPPFSCRVAGGEEAGHRSRRLSSSFQPDWSRWRLLISGSCMSLGNGSGRAGGDYFKQSTKEERWFQMVVDWQWYIQRKLYPWSRKRRDAKLD
jgi:hypothetical protein